ncbi:radical SAM protein [Clostridium luticellarii]|jgi:putative pyruvate formate lyase activating enzyme|uniref:Radical SAM superfamily protein n=1 Tax=Clostridium luticellarii TaxID=1691940 RepID=A0A2T0BP09_9CLOT|nr:radical SAM protein [Clostridium luticellarii]MCI1944615.1 radical SAM protein [Clostridium luticellarii]MCI1968114.1 radical SAM protein [Clostridium luticellarii]MCI1994773.1 radical SAM protein [Clostridium luticellarii]MCI2039005.1 radical SAM protein [Clostridium luticellarii]PRR85619.1 Radical SAM superfamily protein [Clostridium luticellarii]
MLNTLKNCKLCPRKCGINRLEGTIGFCNAGKNVKIAKVSLHKWEEPCISGTAGSGTIFFSHCNLKCVFCQNHSISAENTGKEVSIKRLSNIFLEQQKRGAHNINLVTPTHYIPQIIQALQIAKSEGLTLPILFNTNSYQTTDALKALNGYVDVYLADLKYFSNKYSVKYSSAPDYFSYASKSIREMYNQVGAPKFNNDGLITKGVIIRHLMLPGLLFDSKKIIDYIYNTYGDSVYISIMNQYTPMYHSYKFPEINKVLNPAHYDCFINYCISLGIKNAFIQESGTCSENFVPNFDLQGV